MQSRTGLMHLHTRQMVPVMTRATEGEGSSGIVRPFSFPEPPFLSVTLSGKESWERGLKFGWDSGDISTLTEWFFLRDGPFYFIIIYLFFGGVGKLPKKKFLHRKSREKKFMHNKPKEKKIRAILSTLGFL